MTRLILPGVLRQAAAVAACALLAGCTVSGSGAVPQPRHSGATGLVVSPNGLSMGPGDGATISASENGYSGTYSSTGDCSGIVTVTALGSSQFSVTGVAPGLCTITVSDTSGNSAKIGVSVQTTVIGGQ